LRFLKSARFDLDEKAAASLASEIEAFLRVGSFTLTEWDSLSDTERSIAVQVKKGLQLEAALQQRGVLQAATLEDAAAMLRSAGDEAAASRILLQEAVSKMSAVMSRDEFSGVSR
jgi:hypothetical protein